eukprot:SAG11_NODE_23928_length_381_cov_0.539007_1_plen_63_part_01
MNSIGTESVAIIHYSKYVRKYLLSRDRSVARLSPQSKRMTCRCFTAAPRLAGVPIRSKACALN